MYLSLLPDVPNSRCADSTVPVYIYLHILSQIISTSAVADGKRHMMYLTNGWITVQLSDGAVAVLQDVLCCTCLKVFVLVFPNVCSRCVTKETVTVHFWGQKCVAFVWNYLQYVWTATYRVPDEPNTSEQNRLRSCIFCSCSTTRLVRCCAYHIPRIQHRSTEVIFATLA